MSGNTVTQSASWSLARAARELELRRGEFDLAVHLGYVRTVPDEGGGGRRVAHAEIDRVRSQEDFPEALRERVKAVGTTEGAALLDISTARFTRLARLGLVVPVKLYLNRYRAVVWLYLAEELRRFPADRQNAPLLRGRTPEGLRDQLEAGLDLRPRNWRGRHMGFLLRQADGPWGEGSGRGLPARPCPGGGGRQRSVRARLPEPLPPRTPLPRRAGLACRAPLLPDHDSRGSRRDQLAPRRPGAGRRRGPRDAPRTASDAEGRARRRPGTGRIVPGPFIPGGVSADRSSCGCLRSRCPGVGRRRTGRRSDGGLVAADSHSRSSAVVRGARAAGRAARLVAPQKHLTI